MAPRIVALEKPGRRAVGALARRARWRATRRGIRRSTADRRPPGSFPTGGCRSCPGRRSSCAAICGSTRRYKRRGGRRVRLAGAVRALRARGRGRARSPDASPRAVVAAPRLLRPHRGGDLAGDTRQRPPAQRLALDDRRLGSRSSPAARSRRAGDHGHRDRPARTRLEHDVPTRQDRRRARRPRHAEVRPRRRRRPHPPVVAALRRGGRRRTRRRDSRSRSPSTTTAPLKLADDLAYGIGLWHGCFVHRTLDPLLPARPWRLTRRALS